MVGPLVFAIEPAVVWGMGALGIGTAASIALKDADLSFPNEVRGACWFCHDTAESQTEVKQGTYDGPPPKDWSGAFPDKESNVLKSESTEGEDGEAGEEEENSEQENPVSKDTEPNHPDFEPHKKKKGLQKIPWNKNRKGFPDKKGDYWEPVPDGHKGTHDPHWDVQHPDGSHTPKYPQ